MTDIEKLTKKELLNYLEEISQQLNNIALDQIPIAISELQFEINKLNNVIKEIAKIDPYIERVATIRLEMKEKQN